MKTCFRLALFLLIARPVVGQQPALSEADRVRLAEAFRLADAVRDTLWRGWSDIPFAVLLVTPEREFLVRHPRPSDDFTRVAVYDTLLQSAVYARDRRFSPDLLATFPAVGGLPTVVVGQAEQTGQSSPFWVVTLLHEHFHQLQYAQPDYYEAVEKLDLSGGDQTGMWMLNYPFPYDSATVGARFEAYRDALAGALAGPQDRAAVDAYVEARAGLRDALEEADYRYLSFQLWQEGVARYVEYRVAEAGARQHEPLPAFRRLADFIPYAQVADSLRRALDRELADLDLASWKRVGFYPVGAAEALLLDARRPEWRRRYFDDKFFLERYFEQ